VPDRVVPAAAQVGAPVDHDVLYANASARFADEQASSKGGSTWFVLTAVLFALLALGSFDALSVVLLMGVIMFHELGHFAAMRAFGYRDVKIYFVPLMGALTAGRSHAVANWKRAVVLLMGPLPGLMLAYALVLLSPAELAAHDWFYKLLMMLVFINGANLLPIVPLDGGRLLSVLLFSRSPTLEVVFTVGTASLLVLGCLAIQEWFVAIFAVLVLPGALFQHRLAVAASALAPRHPAMPAEPKALTDIERHELFLAAKATVDRAMKGRAAALPLDRHAAMIGNYMRGIHERAVTRPPRVGVTLLMLAAYAMSVLAIGPILLIMPRPA
jgi:Zn-dependent protease